MNFIQQCNQSTQCRFSIPLTVSVLVASNYAVKVVRTCKGTGGVDDGRLDGQRIKEKQSQETSISSALVTLQGSCAAGMSELLHEKKTANKNTGRVDKCIAAAQSFG